MKIQTWCLAPWNWQVPRTYCGHQGFFSTGYRANGGVCQQFPWRKTVNLHVEKRQFPDTSTVRKLWKGNYLSSESLLASASESSASMFFTGILSSASRFDPAEAEFQTTHIKNLYRIFLSFPILPTKILRKAQIDTFQIPSTHWRYFPAIPVIWPRNMIHMCQQTLRIWNTKPTKFNNSYCRRINFWEGTEALNLITLSFGLHDTGKKKTKKCDERKTK